MSEPKFYTVFEADAAYLKALGDTNTYFSEFEVRLKTLEALGGQIDDSITSLLEVEKKILETVGGIATTTNDIFELRKEIAKAQGLDVGEDFNIWDVAQQEPPIGPKIFTIRFLNWDGTVLQTVEVEEGQTPVYGGTEPTKESDETYDYTFNGWLPEISPANGNVDYVAQFTATEIPSGPEEDPADDITLPYVTFVAEEDGSNVQLIGAAQNSSPYWEYSYDLNNWTKINGNNTADLPLNNGNIVYVRGYTGYTSTSSGMFRQIKVTGKVAAYGNGNALWNFNDLNASLKSNCGFRMFDGSTGLIKTPELPATTLADNCYRQMFYGCTSLTTGPSVLPATTLDAMCYYTMFAGCRSLATAPELPATTLADNCYGSMFSNTALTTAPALPATTLTTNCYNSMFFKCTALTKAPELNATTLPSMCYFRMFYNCTSLKEITCLATDISASGCTGDWVYGLSSSGTFYKDPSMTSWTTGVNGIPEGWVINNYEEPDTPEEDPADDITLPYVTVLVEDDDLQLVGINSSGSSFGWLEYSTDLITWTGCTTSPYPSMSQYTYKAGDKIYFRGKITKPSNSYTCPFYIKTTSSTANNARKYSMYGSIRALVDYENMGSVETKTDFIYMLNNLFTSDGSKSLRKTPVCDFSGNKALFKTFNGCSNVEICTVLAKTLTSSGFLQDNDFTGPFASNGVFYVSEDLDINSIVRNHYRSVPPNWEIKVFKQ